MLFKKAIAMGRIVVIVERGRNEKVPIQINACDEESCYRVKCQTSCNDKWQFV